MEIDPRFKTAQKRAAQRRRKSWLKPLLIWGLASLTLSGAALALYLEGIVTIGTPVATVEPQDDAGTGATLDGAAAAYSSAFVDLAGDPMVLRFDTGTAAQNTRNLLRPVEISATRAGNDLALLNDDLITGQERLITTLPSSREDFAFFQAQRQAPAAARPVAPMVATTPAAPETVVVQGQAASWGENLDGSTDTGPDSYTKTRIEDTTSLNFVLPEAQRKLPYTDVFLRLKDSTDLASLMQQNSMDKAAAERFATAGAALMPELAHLTSGYILAIRAADRGGISVPVQLSLNSADAYFGSVAVDDLGQVVKSADPWVDQDLSSFGTDQPVAEVDNSRKFRMLDAFYSAAIRNGVPSAVVAETIVLMSQSFDLESFAAPGDKMTLLYAPKPGSDGPGPGQILYAAIKGEGKSLECHVFKPAGKEEYGCFGAGTGAGPAGDGVTLRAGMQTPVQGVLTARFGPSIHPVLHKPKLNKGVDWAAPVGTPVVAAFDGTILSAGDGGNFGNLVQISHDGGMETHYAHLSAFAEGITAGAAVKAGSVIGYVGNTGLSTGPHLHFELYENGEAVDPFTADGGGSAVEVLVDQIIRVESGGKADAKNPLSTATGAGQFIESTWLRMMQQYRPDLAGSMSRGDLLALRNDPTISRDMVTALAREGEAYLRARGHQITAGRLYLCHFLGAEGANLVLSAQDDQLVLDVMGQGVIAANPFLTDKTIAYVKDWAEQKMSHKGGGAAIVVVPPEVLAYEKSITALIGSPT